MARTVFVTGVSGCGKTSVGEAMRAAGETVLDLDDYCAQFGADGRPVKEYRHDDPAWVSGVTWMCDTGGLRGALAEAKGERVFCVGACTNVADVFPLFDASILLRADVDTIKRRLSTRTGNPWGRAPAVQHIVVAGITGYEKIAIDHGAIVVDASPDIATVAKSVLDAT